jgi:hypothetical protein
MDREERDHEKEQEKYAAPCPLTCAKRAWDLPAWLHVIIISLPCPFKLARNRQGP